MLQTLRRLAILGVLLGGAAAAFTFVRRSREPGTAVANVAEWPPFDEAAAEIEQLERLVAQPAAEVNAGAALLRSVTVTDEPSAHEYAWLAPVDGQCPTGFPIKANDNSGIFHIPGGRFYDRTIPERCYARADDAIADGYRPAKA